MLPIILGVVGAGFLVSAYSEKKKFAKGGEIDNEMYARLDKIKDWTLVRKEQFKGKDIYLTLSKSDGYYKTSIISNGKDVPKTNVYFTNKQDAENNFNEKIQKHFAKAGSIPNNYEGKTPEQVWNEWSEKQREHFCYDHNLMDNVSWKTLKMSSEQLKKDNWGKEFGNKNSWDWISGILSEHISEGQYAKGGEVKDSVVKAIFYPNEKVRKGGINKINTDFGEKTYTGLESMILNEAYSPTEIAEAIFSSNAKKGLVETRYGRKNVQGLTEMIEDARSNAYAKGGKLSKYKYVPNRDVEAIELNKKGKTVEVDGADVLDGVYVKKGKFAKGGSMAKTKKDPMKKEVKKSSGAKKSNPQTGKLKEVMAHAKATRKDGEAWKSAVARAWKEVGK